MSTFWCTLLVSLLNFFSEGNLIPRHVNNIFMSVYTKDIFWDAAAMHFTEFVHHVSLDWVGGVLKKSVSNSLRLQLAEHVSSNTFNIPPSKFEPICFGSLLMISLPEHLLACWSTFSIKALKQPKLMRPYKPNRFSCSLFTHLYGLPHLSYQTAKRIKDQTTQTAYIFILFVMYMRFTIPIISTNQWLLPCLHFPFSIQHIFNIPVGR